MTNVEKIKLMTTKELLAKYNELTGKSIKRFSSREAGEAQTIAAMTRAPSTPAVATPVVATPKEKAKSAKVKAKAAATPKAKAAKAKAEVAGAVITKTTETLGRPKLNFKIRLADAEGSTAIRETSDRGKILSFMREKPAGTAFAMSDLITKFGTAVKGHVQKLKIVGWVVRVDE
jgi:hypothetical protein